MVSARAISSTPSAAMAATRSATCCTETSPSKGQPQTQERVTDRLGAAPDATLRLHFHDTRNTGLANAYAGVEAGIDILDASCGGIGGCPFAPGATGNIATEDLVYMLERAGFTTSYDLGALIDTAGWIGGQLGIRPPSALSRAGPFPKP